MYVGLPNPADPLIYVHMDDLEQFMNNTSIEAYPDENGDGSQDQDEGGNPVFPDAESICGTNSDLQAARASDLRTQNADAFDGNGNPKPLVSLNDVKPGDFGELTLSFHLCDNPGYVWLQGALRNASENGTTEPERKDPDEDADDGGSVVELLDAVETLAWYDEDGDNVKDGGMGGNVCAHLVLDSSGSMTATDGDGVTRQDEMKAGAKQLAAAILGAGGRVGVTEFDSDANMDTGGGSPLVSLGSGDSSDQTAIDSAIDSINAAGDTAINTGIAAANADLGNCAEDERAVMIVVTDGQNNAGSGPVQTASDAAIASNTDEIFAVGTGGANLGTLTAIANPDDDAHIELTSDLTNAIANLAQVVLGEECFFRGTLREFLDALSTAQDDDGNVPGIPLDGNRATNFNEVPGDDSPDEDVSPPQPSGPASEARECFNASDTNHIGIAWYLPVDHANEIQTDRVAFDIGFYTEQCRHNDGSGQTPETPVPNGG
jgi:hypothetical protein